MSINIGDKNKIKGSAIGHQYGSSNANNGEADKKKTFVDKHPVIISFLVSLIVGFILLFSFWGKVINLVENFFK